MDVGWTPGVGVVVPRVRSGPDRDEAIATVVVRDRSARPGKIRIERRGVLVDLVRVAPGGIRLPDLDQRLRYRTAILVDDAAFDIETTEPDWSLAFKFDLVLRGREATPFGI